MDAKQLEKIVSILEGWILNDLYEWDTCINKLLTSGVSEEEAWEYMDAVNFKDVEEKGVKHALELYLEEKEVSCEEESMIWPSDEYDDTLNYV